MVAFLTIQRPNVLMGSRSVADLSEVINSYVLAVTGLTPPYGPPVEECDLTTRDIEAILDPSDAVRAFLLVPAAQALHHDRHFCSSV